MGEVRSSIAPGNAADVAVIGAGAAGLMAAIWAGRKGESVIALDGAKQLGAKILVAGGGRCNVTHHEVDEKQYAGSSRNAIRKVLRRFDVPETVRFFNGLGVELKREETGKLFPVTDDAHTVLDALLGAVRAAGVRIAHPWRVLGVRRVADGFEIHRDVERDKVSGERGETIVRAGRVILATGGMALPRTGSDGGGYAIAKGFGHTVSERVFPALVPLLLQSGHWITTLSGLTVNATLELHSATGKRLESFTNSTLCTHFGLSGPGVLDISRYYTAAKEADPGACMVMNWLPGEALEDVDEKLRNGGKLGIARVLTEMVMPERLARALCAAAQVDGSMLCHALTREKRRGLAAIVAQSPLPITGDRGFTFAEATAGGVPLSEIHLETMESRVCPGLYLCGEVLDVDGRVGGFNFQWAWSSGYVAGVGDGRP